MKEAQWGITEGCGSLGTESYLKPSNSTIPTVEYLSLLLDATVSFKKPESKGDIVVVCLK